MTDWPPVTVIIPTLSMEQCNRRAVLRETVNSLKRNLRYSGGWWRPRFSNRALTCGSRSRFRPASMANVHPTPM
jgi:hypothetical protein